MSMRFRKHRNIFPLCSICFQLSDQFFNLGIIHFFQRLLDRKRNRGIINILRCQAEMNKFLVFIQSAQLIKFFFKEILHRFHIVIGHTFYFFNALGICFRKVTIDSTQSFKYTFVDSFELWQRQFTQSDEIFHFYLHAVFYQCVFRKIVSQSFCFASVSAVNRRNSR